MMSVMRHSLTAALAVALAACGGPSADETPPANSSVAESDAEESGREPFPAGPVPTGPGNAEPTPDAAPEEPPFTPAPDAVEDAPAGTVNAAIPAALHGRWGLATADCTSTRGDAKGLLTIDRDTLRFYESRATLGRVIERDRSRIVADFAFTGEGQSWERRMILDAQDRGRTLIRREGGADAMPGPLRYRRCEA